MNLPAWQFSRIIDISDETKPTVVSKQMLEAYDPKNCAQVLPDLAGLGSFTYGAHYCSVDNKKNATTLACAYFNSGIRVFDIRNPVRVKEIAYFNPPGHHHSESRLESQPNGRMGGRVVPTGARLRSSSMPPPARCRRCARTTAYMVLKFTNGVWPFPGVTTPPGLQN